MNGRSSNLRSSFLLAALVLLLPLPVRAQLLQVNLSGLEGALQKNALAWLGELPETPQARSNYLHTVEDKLTGSLQALGYYRADIRLDLDRSQPLWVLNVDIDPGEPVRWRRIDLQVLGAGASDDAFAQLVANSGLKPGEPLNHETYQSLRRRINALGLQRGYFDGRFSVARVEVEPVGGTADVYLHYASGERYRFGDVAFDTTLVDEDVVSALLAFREGDFYDQDRLRDSQVQLQRTGYFSTVILRPALGEASGGEVPMRLELFPASRHSFDIGVGYSTDTEERVTVTWRTPRVNSLGHSQETRLQYSTVNPSGRFTYSIPMSHPLNDILQFSTRVEDNEFGDLDSRQKEVGVRREFKRGNWVYSYSLRALEEEWNAIGFKQESDYLLPGVSVSQRLRRGSLVNPESGFSQWYRVEAGHSSVVSDMDLLRITANYGYIHSFGERHRAVLRSDLGAVFLPDGERDNLAPSLNFFAGGSQSIRGFGYQSIGRELTTTNDKGEEVTLVVGGERLATASAEYQYSFSEHWRGALFVDAGDAFDQGDFDLKYAVGFGIHYVTPIGAIRFELADPLSEDDPSWRMHLAVGAEF